MINNRFINHEDRTSSKPAGHKFNCSAVWSISCSCSLSLFFSLALSCFLPLSTPSHTHRLSLSFSFTRVSSCRYRRGALLFAHKAAERVRIKYDSRRYSKVVSPESFAPRRRDDATGREATIRADDGDKKPDSDVFQSRNFWEANYRVERFVGTRQYRSNCSRVRNF